MTDIRFRQLSQPSKPAHGYFLRSLVKHQSVMNLAAPMPIYGTSTTNHITAMIQRAVDDCAICYTEKMNVGETITLTCGHAFHLQCCRQQLTSRWAGPRISFGFACCPICKTRMIHTLLDDLLTPINALYEDVRRKALIRLEYEGQVQRPVTRSVKGQHEDDLARQAMERYAYYQCFKCWKAYYGGEARCAAQVGLPVAYNLAELVCNDCQKVPRSQECKTHNADYLQWKCRYCCKVALWFCFGTTHFCDDCHNDHGRITTTPRNQLPQCPAGPKMTKLDGCQCPLNVSHPPTGEEFVLGCAICQNEMTF